MPEVYYYVKSGKVADILDCGLKLSSFYDKEVLIAGENKLCFSGLLNPKDDMKLYKSDSFTCLKIQVKSSHCFIADRFKYETFQNKNEEIDSYYKSIIPIEQYRFGEYRLPECLITTTILDGEASVLDKIMDSPVLYTNSEELYINNILLELREQCEEVDNDLLYYFFDKLADLKKLDKIENSDTKTTIFFTKSGKTFCIRTPELNKMFE